MNKITFYLLALVLLASCSNVTTGFEMIGEFEDGEYINDFSVDSRYWPSEVMVVPERTDLNDKKFEAVAIFNDYGIMNEQNPVGYNISHFTQEGLKAKRTTIFSIEDNPSIYLYLDDVNADAVAYSTLDEDLDLYECYISSLDGKESNLVAAGDGGKLNSYSVVIGTDIYWSEIDGNNASIKKDGLTGSKETILEFKNAYVLLLKNNGPYFVYYIEEFDEEFNLIRNDVELYDVDKDAVIKTIEIDEDFELTSGSYDGESLFFTAYDYGNEEYTYAKLNKDGNLDVYDTDIDGEYTFFGTGNKVLAMKRLSGMKSDFYEANYMDLSTNEEENHTDLLYSGINNDYMFYVKCYLNNSNLIEDVRLVIKKAK